MTNKQNYIHQEKGKFNKPKVLIKQNYKNGLTATEKHIYNYIVRTLLQEPKGFSSMKFTQKELIKESGGRRYEDALKHLQNLRDTGIHIYNEETGKYKYTGLIRDFDYVQEKSNTATIEVFFEPLLVRAFSSEKFFAKLDLIELQALKNTHSITLYEMFKRGLNKHLKTRLNYTEKELRIYLNLETKYKEFKRFHQFAVVKPLEEINNKTVLEVRFERVKIDGEYLYKFKVSQPFNFTFTRFKKLLIAQCLKYNRGFNYKNRGYFFDKDENDKNPKYLLVDYSKYMAIGENHFDANCTTTTEFATDFFESCFEKFKENQLRFLIDFFYYQDPSSARFDAAYELTEDELKTKNIDEIMEEFRL